MLGTPLVLLALLVGQTTAPTQPGVKQKSTPKDAAPADRDNAMSEYNVLKEKTPMTAAARWKLALWCEEHRLKDLMYVHLGEVISLEPGRDAAWRKLGFKKLGDRWASEAEIAEDLAQKKADKRWGPTLKKVHKDISRLRVRRRFEMIGTPLIALAALVGQTAAAKDSGEKKDPAVKRGAPVGSEKAISEYNILHANTPMTAAARWKLALWCEEHRLKDLAVVHFGEVISLDPGRDAAWRKLGFKKQGNRWVSDGEIAEEQELKKADKRWGPLLKKVHKDIHGTNGKARRVAAEAEFDKIKDPTAVVPAYRELAGGGETDHWLLIDFLSRIEGPAASKVMALVAVYGKSKEIRRSAIEVLRTRKSDEYLELLVGLMADEYKYEVRQVGGPGSLGVLFVEGEKFNVRRFYAPPAAPNILPQPGDIIAYDSLGEPIIIRAIAEVGLGEAASIRGTGLAAQERVGEYAEISPLRVEAEAVKGAVEARRQLDRDVDMIKLINKERKAFNELVMEAAKDASGKDHGETPKEWREKVLGKGFSKPPGDKPTYPEMAVLEYNPELLHVTTRVILKVFIDDG